MGRSSSRADSCSHIARLRAGDRGGWEETVMDLQAGPGRRPLRGHDRRPDPAAPGGGDATARIHAPRGPADRLLLPLSDAERADRPQRGPREGPAHPARGRPAGTHVLDCLRRLRADVPAGDPERRPELPQPVGRDGLSKRQGRLRGLSRELQRRSRLHDARPLPGLGAFRAPDRGARRRRSEAPEALRRGDRARSQYRRPDRRSRSAGSSTRFPLAPRSASSVA